MHRLFCVFMPLVKKRPLELQLQLSVDCHSPVMCFCGGTCHPTSLASKWHHTHTRSVVATTFKVLSDISAMMGRSDAVSVTKQQPWQCISAPSWLQKKTAMFRLFLITGCGSNSSIMPLQKDEIFNRVCGCAIVWSFDAGLTWYS